MSRLRFATAALAVIAALGAAPAASADDAGELERGRNSYDAGRYDEGAERFRAMLDPASPHPLRDPTAIARARAYFAACLVALGSLDEADRQFEAILRADPTFRPDPVELPGRVVDRFTDVKARLRPELEARESAERSAREKARLAHAAYVAELERLAGEESVVVRRSRWVAALPLGVGQLQNGDVALGWTLLATESALAAVSIASAVSWQVRVSQHEQTGVDLAALDQQIDAARTVNLWSTAAFAAVAIGGVVQAQIAFVPEAHEVRRRPLPRRPNAAVSVVPMGLGVGFVGAF